jgi:hypothetical protein
MTCSLIDPICISEQEKEAGDENEATHNIKTQVIGWQIKEWNA